jgi:hypothetical protein
VSASANLKINRKSNCLAKRTTLSVSNIQAIILHPSYLYRSSNSDLTFFSVSIESVGILAPEILFEEAVKVLLEKITKIQTELAKLQQTVEDRE